MLVFKFSERVEKTLTHLHSEQILLFKRAELMHSICSFDCASLWSWWWI